MSERAPTSRISLTPALITFAIALIFCGAAFAISVAIPTIAQDAPPVLIMKPLKFSSTTPFVF